MTGIQSIRVEIYESIGEIDQLAPDWIALEERTPEATGFQSFTWCRSWLAARQTSGSLAKLCVVAVFGDQRLVMLWPLEIEQQAKISIARWIGEPITQYGDILAEPGEDRVHWFEAAREHLWRRRGVDLFALSRLRGDSVLAQLALGLEAAGPRTSAPFVDLTCFEHRENGRSRHKSMSRRAKQLASLGQVSLRVVEDPAARIETVRTALAQKRFWLQAKGLYSTGLTHAATDAFFDRIAATGNLLVHALLVGQETAAVEIGFIHRTAYRSLLGTFGLRFAAGSPGHALTSLLLEKCAAQGLETFDFLAPNDPYKMIWAKKTVEIDTLLKPLTIWGHAGAFALKRLRPLAKRAQTALPQSARRALRKIAASP
ncbi:MAG: GNAT family N-acetyltransferase [Beijerinckiaceae bacterium]|jgi:CelD/BcsL family acetyltransferase involved in cellulose biosynthesis